MSLETARILWKVLGILVGYEGLSVRMRMRMRLYKLKRYIWAAGSVHKISHAFLQSTLSSAMTIMMTVIMTISKYVNVCL